MIGRNMKRSDGKCDIPMSMPLQVSTFTASTPELVTTTHILAELHHEINLENIIVDWDDENYFANFLTT